MSKRRFILFSLLISVLLIVSACSGDTSSEDEGTTEDETTEEAGTSEESGEAEGLILSGDIVSEQGGCVLASRFAAGDKIVFRMDAVDAAGEQVTDATLQVHLSTGETLDMEYGPHGDDNFWVAAYPVTEDTPTGTLEYHVTAEAGDLSAEWKPFNVAPSLLTIVDPDEVAAAETEEPAEEEEEVDLANVETTDTVDIIATNFDFNEDVWYVKAGEEITVNLTSEEGIHGIDILGLDVAINESEGTVTFTPTETGEFEIVCNVFCGEGHGDMTAKLVVV